MKKTFAKLALPSILAVAMLLTSCATPGPNKSAGAAIPDYATAEQIKAMPPCQATVVENNTCDSLFRTGDGKMFYIGSPAAKQEVIQFLRTLKEGQTYKFPGAFLTHQKQHSQ